MRPFYPIVSDISDKKCLVVGGGRVAERKINGLLQACAHIAVVSPKVTDTIAEWHKAGQIELAAREYVSGDGEGAVLIFACTDDADVNRHVHADAIRRGQPVNVADQPDLCTFVVPAVWRQGHLLVAVSTSGTSPMASSRIRDRIEAAIGDGIDGFLVFAAQYRNDVLSKIADPGRRRRLLADLFSDEALDAVRAGDWDGLRNEMTARLDEECRE